MRDHNKGSDIHNVLFNNRLAAFCMYNRLWEGCRSVYIKYTRKDTSVNTKIDIDFLIIDTLRVAVILDLTKQAYLSALRLILDPQASDSWSALFLQGRFTDAFLP
jgi:hypothetical protein